jgi:hypothetical protein
MGKLDNRVAIVTGASSGMGKEIARGALFLTSDDSSFINAATIVADAGWSAYGDNPGNGKKRGSPPDISFFLQNRTSTKKWCPGPFTRSR